MGAQLTQLFPTQKPQIAHIRSSECIGCTKCIQACPFDAIIGTARYLHVILTDACTGCKLCITPCPVDCIEMREVDSLNCQPEVARQRVKARKQRLQGKAKQRLQDQPSKESQQAYIDAAVARVKAKKKQV